MIPRFEPTIADLGRRSAAWLGDCAFMGAVVYAALALSGGIVPYIGLVLGLPFIYGVLGDARGATLGKALVQIKVVDSNTDAPIGWKRALVRRAAYYAGGFFFFLGWLRAFRTSDHRAWHDVVANTLVVRRERGRPEDIRVA